MGLGDVLPVDLGLELALAVAFATALAALLVAMPRILPKLRGAGIVGRDIHKPGRPEVPEMGGIGVFLAFNVGVFALLLVHPLPAESQLLVLTALLVAAGAAITGVMDDIIELRQRFKAFIPIVFAAPLAVYLVDWSIELPFLGAVPFGFVYPVLLVPLGIACASNGFNMLEGYNGLGAGVGIVMTACMIVLVILGGRREALILLVPLLGALLGFLWFNKYPAKVFPGDTMTLLVGAVLAASAMIGKIEFWGALLFLPQIAEFLLKARGRFEGENFARKMDASVDPPLLAYEGRTESLTHIVLKRVRLTEPAVSGVFWALQTMLAVAVVAGYLATHVR